MKKIINYIIDFISVMFTGNPVSNIKKDKSYKTIIITITVAFICLLGIQFYWTKQSIYLAHQQFEQNVRKSFHTLNRELEKQEAAYFYKTHTQHRRKMRELHQRLDSLKDNIHNGISHSIDCLIIDNDQNDNIVFKQRIKIDTGTNFSDVTIEFDVSDSGDIETNIEQSIEQKSRQLEHIFREMMVQSGNPFESRFDLNEIEGLISTSLFSNGIKTDFNYQLLKHGFTGTNQLISSEVLPDLNNAYHTRILPGLMGSGKNELIISFPNKYLFVARRVWIMLLSSVILIAILIYAFYYSITSLIKQRKIAELKNDFISNMTHELKTPITSINLACETIGDPNFNFNRESVSNYLNIISDENRRLKILVNNVLDSSFIDSEQLKLAKTEVDLFQLVNEVKNRFNVILENRNGNIKINSTTPDLTLWVDRFHFSNVLFNIIDNAIKYVENEPRILINLEQEDSNIIIKILDNGIGISKTHQLKIFDKFHRVSQGNIHNVKGFGLGLNYVKRIVEMHNGQISVESELDRGSTFIIKMPIQ